MRRSMVACRLAAVLSAMFFIQAIPAGGAETPKASAEIGSVNMPASVMGDLVSGAVCVGAITMGSPTVLIGYRPAARLTSQVTGVNAVTGAPLTTAVGPPCCPTVLIA